MTGCSRAVAERDRLRAAAAQCPTLAYGLHRQGGACRRIGGLRQCGECAGDLLPVIFKQSMEKPGARISSEN
jgi:hypothetical protein